MDELTDLITKAVTGCKKLDSLNKIAEKEKKKINVVISDIVKALLKEDFGLQKVFSEATFSTREEVVRAIFAKDKNWNFSKYIFYHFCNDLQRGFDQVEDGLLKELNRLKDVGKIIQSNKQEILMTIEHLDHLKLGIIPILYGANIDTLIKIDGDDSGFHFFGNRGIDLVSFKKRKNIRNYDLDNYLKYFRACYVPDKEYVVMFVESEDNDVLYEKMLIENGFVKMDLYTAIFIYRITKLFFKDIYLTNPDKQKPEYSFSLDWVSGKDVDGDHYDNPTILMHYNKGVFKRNKKYKFIKVLKLP